MKWLYGDCITACSSLTPLSESGLACSVPAGWPVTGEEEGYCIAGGCCAEVTEMAVILGQIS